MLPHHRRTLFFARMAHVLLILTIAIPITCSVTARAQVPATTSNAHTPTASETNSETSGTNPLAPILTGPLQFRPSAPVLRIIRSFDSTCVMTAFHVAVKNVSSSDIRVALLGAALSAVDDLGFDLFTHQANYFGGIEEQVSGILVLAGRADQWANTVNENKSQFSTLSPQQSFIIQIQKANDSMTCVQDKNQDFLKTHRPQAVTITGALSVINLDGNTDVRSFSFSDLPTKLVH